MATFYLTDIHSLILAAAASRPDGNLLPPPEGLGELSDQLRAAYRDLFQNEFATEIETDAPDQIWRDDDGKTYGLILTDKGKAAAAEPTPSTARAPKKIAIVVGLLRREQGATLTELIDATGWLPHTTRAALTGLRKKGHAIDRATRDGATCYSIAAAA